MRLSELAENLLLPLTAVVTVVLDLADTFDWFHFFPNGSASTLILLLCALMIGTLCFIQHQLRAVQEHLRFLLSQKLMESLDSLPNEINPDLRLVLQDGYFEDILEFLHTAVEADQALINSAVRFRYYFAKMLQNFPRSTFYLTGPISICSLWQDALVEQATQQFLRTGGKLKIVLVAQDEQEIGLPSTQAALKLLRRANVPYSIVNGASRLADPHKFFIVESSGRIAWELLVIREGNVEKSILTANKRQVSAYTRAFEKLWDDELQKRRRGV